MTSDPFRRLAPFIREFIYAKQWSELRAVQVEACRVIFETDSHLLLATGTASGKTEAAFMPILTLLAEDPPASVGVLYVGPLKALINDQFARLEELLKDTDTPVWHWHGDVTAGHKKKLLKRPRGVLQITPESLESMHINRPGQLGPLFADLRFVVIDEVHALMGSDRGRQVLCQLGRLARHIRTEPRRIGLSATLGDTAMAAQWLASGTSRQAVAAQVETADQTIRIGLEHFVVPGDADDRVGDGCARGSACEQTAALPDRYIFQRSLSRKCLIFANSRADVESIVASLRQIARREGTPDVYHAHHGSIAAPLRLAAEEAMKDSVLPAVTAATVTLELGIDIGRLERIIQLEAPFSVSGFVQRLGRSGRRGAPPEIWFVCAEKAPEGKDILSDMIPWSLLQAIAIIQLYVEERWIEPVRQPKYPLSLLYHQTMSTLASCGELSPAALAQRVLHLPPFANIGPDMYREFLRYVINLDHIQQTERGHLIIGLAGEKVVRNFRFYAVFADNEEYAVLAEGREIGSIMNPPPAGEKFALAGRAWEVVEVDDRTRRVFARQVEGRSMLTGKAPEERSTRGSCSECGKFSSRTQCILTWGTGHAVDWHRLAYWHAGPEWRLVAWSSWGAASIAYSRGSVLWVSARCNG